MVPAPEPSLRARLCREGIALDGRVLPLLAGSVHYWRLTPNDWHAALSAVRDMGLKLVDTYVPWAVHERVRGVHDFGSSDPRLDVKRFVSLARELGLYVIVRPGPHINAELTRFGIPERIVWDERCQARSPRGQRVILPVPPLAFPVPSYASGAFLDESAAWLSTVARELGSLVYPAGPIVLVQVDNEGALYFRDGVYDQDWHPDAIAVYHALLREKYGSVSRLRELYGAELESFESVEPPRRFSAQTPHELLPHLDWAEAQERVVTRALSHFRAALEQSGFGGLPFSHNLPLGENATPLDPGALGRAVDLIGLDYYHVASADSAAAIARRTGELALRAQAGGYPAFSCELGAGFPPFFPPLAERDCEFTALCALAYGLRHFNLYMAVERDRWIGAPVDRRGQRRKSFEFWQKLAAALERTRFFELEREIAVAIVVPRELRRLFRALHAFGPVSSAWFEIAGGGAIDACVEDELGLGGPRAVSTAQFLRELERQLDSLRVPFALVGSDVLGHALETARWLVVACDGALEKGLLDRLLEARQADVALSFAPYLPERDATFRALASAPQPAFADEPVPLLLPGDPEGLSRALARVRAVLDLPALNVEAKGARVTLHRDRAGVPRVAFVINPEGASISARIELPELRAASDVLDGTQFHASRSTLEVSVEPLSGRMLALDVGSPNSQAS